MSGTSRRATAGKRTTSAKLGASSTTWLHGQQTRTHRDLDLGVRLDDVPRIETLLPQFRRESVEEWPGFLRLRDERGRVVDLLLVGRSEAGELWQQLAGGRRVRRKESETRASGCVGGR